MWAHNYVPIAGGLPLSTLMAAIPLFVLLLLVGVLRQSAWVAALSGLLAAAGVAFFGYGMPAKNLIGAVSYGAAYGLFPIGWIVFGAMLLYNLTVETGKFTVIQNSVGHLTNDPRVQALLIAFTFGAFLEGASGFGAPVAIAAAILTGLGFSSFYAAALCLLANTVPVAFGGIGIPIVTLAGVTGLPLERLGAAVGRICAPVSLFIPAYLIVVMGGWKALRGVLPAVVVCGVTFAGLQFLISNFVSMAITDIVASLSAMIALVALLRVWTPRDMAANVAPVHSDHTNRYTTSQLLEAWSPYLVLVVLVVAWGTKPIAAVLNSVSIPINWPWLHNQTLRMPPVVTTPTLYPAVFNFNWLSAAGTFCVVATVIAAVVLRAGPRQLAAILLVTTRRLLIAELTMALVLATAFLMNYSGITGTLGLAFAATGRSFPFFSPILGWLAVFLTGSDTSANALFGSLQAVTATRLGMSPVLMAAANSTGGVMGKMISLASIAVASAATSMKREEESRLFRFTIRHSIFLASVIGLVVLFYNYVAPSLIP